MPPVAHIKKFEVDPYTLQVESDKDSEVNYSGDEDYNGANRDFRTKTKKQEAAWWVRKPAKPSQGNLKTGYEPIIAAKK